MGLLAGQLAGCGRSLWQALQACVLPAAAAAALPQCSALRSLASFSAPSRQQHQLQQDAPAAAPDSGLAFDDVFVDSSSLSVVDTPGARRLTQEPPITAVFLHGLLGSSKNWRSFTRKLALEAAATTNRDVRCLLVDLRCHGSSAARFGMHPPHSMAAAAADVAGLLQQQLGGAAPHLLVGLSLGGKVALELMKQLVDAQEQQQHHHLYAHAPPIAPPEDLPPAARQGASSSASGSSSSAGQQQQAGPVLQGVPQQVWVLDSQPGTVPLDVDAPTSVGKIIQLIHSVPMPLDSRQQLYKLLEQQGIPLAVAQWLGTSLVPGGRWGSSNVDGKLAWAFDIQGAAALYHSYRLSSYWDCLRNPPPGVTIHLVRGELSDRWTPHMLQQLEAAQDDWEAATAADPAGVGELRLHLLARAGHWLQADNPDGLASMMLPWFRDLHQNRLMF